jgi:predicted Rossmann-fold nucleotide-binding protein
MTQLLIRPEGSLQILSRYEVQQLHDHSDAGLNDLLRQCALAVLNAGDTEDNGLKLIERHPDFTIQVRSHGRGMQLELTNPPTHALVNGELITGLKEHLFAVVRDLIYTNNELRASGLFDWNDSSSITNVVFHQLRNAQLLKPNLSPNIVVCWGGHAISRFEYDYSKFVGYELGLRGMDICTGCGPGAMKGPMKGAAVGHGKQRTSGKARYIGITEPGIIAAEAPNAVVNELVIMPDIEKRLEAFIRLGHGIVIFPGGAGTMEELLYLFSILMHPDNEGVHLPVLLTGPSGSEAYFAAIESFILATLGLAAWQKLTIMIDQPEKLAEACLAELQRVRAQRKASSDAYYFNWQLTIPWDLQQPFEPSHTLMSQLNLSSNQPAHQLASQLRKAFSGIVAGNVKAKGILAVQQQGPFQLQGDAHIMQAIDQLLTVFIEQKRMKLGSKPYQPCYRIESRH